jgi:hypothetical protein
VIKSLGKALTNLKLLSTVLVVVVVAAATGGAVIQHNKQEAARKHEAAITLSQSLGTQLRDWGFEAPGEQDLLDVSYYVFNDEQTQAEVRVKLTNGSEGRVHLVQDGSGWKLGCFGDTSFTPYPIPLSIDTIKVAGCRQYAKEG